MRTRLCNKCDQFTRVDDWEFGCPNCGHTNGRPTGYFSEFPGVEVMPDIKPYKNMINGQEIGSRSTHRELLRRHNCIEIGNETKTLLAPRERPDVAPQQRKELLIAQVQAFGGFDNLKKAIKREVEHIRWNSRSR